MQKKISTAFAVSVVVILVGFFCYVIWQANNMEKEEDIIANNAAERNKIISSPGKKMPATLSSEGKDTAGRELKIEDIPVSNIKFTLSDSESESSVKNEFAFQNIKRYKLSTPVGIAPIFYVEQTQKDGTMKKIEVNVPDKKNIIGIKMLVSNKEDNSSFSLNPNFLLSNNDIKIAPVNANNINFTNIPRGASVEFEYLFAVDANLDTFVLSFGEKPKATEGKILIDFGKKSCISLD